MDNSLTDGIPEFPVKIPKMTGYKDKKIRILNVNQLPRLQIKSLHKDHISEHDISRASKIFKDFQSKGHKNCIKIITKDKILLFIFLNIEDLNNCTNYVNKILQTYHRVRESTSSLIDRTSTESNTTDTSDQSNDKVQIRNSPARKKFNRVDPIPSYEINSKKERIINLIDPNNDANFRNPGSNDINFSLMPVPSLYATLDDIPPIMPKKLDDITDDIPPTLTKTLEDITNDYYPNLFDRTYIKPSFTYGTNTLNGGYEQLEKYPFRKNNSDIDKNIFDCLKIREEIQNENGVLVKITDDLINGFTIQQINDELWITSIPCWSNCLGKLHVGDRIVAINNQQENIQSDYNKLVKDEKEFTLTIQRLPMARVFIIDKTKEDSPIVMDERKLVLKEDNLVNEMSWEITEINLIDTFQRKPQNENYDIISIIKSPIRYLLSIVQPTTFLQTFQTYKSNETLIL